MVTFKTTLTRRIVETIYDQEGDRWPQTPGSWIIPDILRVRSTGVSNATSFNA